MKKKTVKTFPCILVLTVDATNATTEIMKVEKTKSFLRCENGGCRGM
jgi:hypothetical protein